MSEGDMGECSTDDDADPPPSGPTLALLDGRYELSERIGGGNGSVIYRAKDVWLDRSVAIKIIAPAEERDDHLVESLRTEAQALAQLRHEHVVQVYAFGPLGAVGRSFFLATELVDGPTLEDVLAQQKARCNRFDTTRAMYILRSIGRGLAVVHASRLAHRGVKPSNIVLERDTGRPVLMHFEHARANLAVAEAHEHAHERANDIFALTCTAYEIFTGQPPFPEEPDPYAIVAADLDGVRRVAPELSRLRPDLRELDSVFARALALEPSLRYPTCAAFLGDLERAAARIPPEMPVLRRRNAPPIESVVRILILERNAGLLRQLVRTAERTLRGLAEGMEIACVETAEDLYEVFAHEPSDIVILDEDDEKENVHGGVGAERIVANLRGIRAAVEVLILKRASSSMPPSAPSSRNAKLVAPTVRELKKPLNAIVLAAVLTKMTSAVVEARRGDREVSGIALSPARRRTPLPPSPQDETT